jgi:hypothetical protein
VIMNSALNRPSLDLKNGEYYLWRLSEDEYRKLHENSIRIRINELHIFNFWLSEREDINRLSLPKALLSLEAEFGRSSDFVDSWKCSFTFPLLLRVTRTDGQFLYLLRIGDFRGTIDFWIYRIIESGTDTCNDISQDPIESEFSQEEIDQFISFLIGFLKSRTHSLSPKQPFLMMINSEHLIYGYDGQDFFEEEFESEADYFKAIANFDRKFPALRKKLRVEYIQSLLAEIIG